jgi:hypothetical protein
LRVLVSALVVISLGSLLHFAWEWSGRNPLVAVVAATNESTWEHLKLAFWPALLVALVQRRVYGGPPGWLPATVLRVLIPPLLIVLLFYGYVGIMGAHQLWVDIAIFVLAVVVGEVVGHAVMWMRPGLGTRVGAGLLLVTSTAAFATLSFRPPAFFLFVDPTEEGTGATGDRDRCRRAPSVVAAES